MSLLTSAATGERVFEQVAGHVELWELRVERSGLTQRKGGGSIVFTAEWVNLTYENLGPFPQAWPGSFRGAPGAALFWFRRCPCDSLRRLHADRIARGHRGHC